MKLENKQYKDFVLKDIIRPYQNILGLGDKRIERLTFELYSQIPIFADEHTEWWVMVLNRLNKIYSYIDLSIIPKEDYTGYFILQSIIQYRNKNNLKFGYFEL